MWKLQPTEEFAARHKRWGKNHPAELKAVLGNLDTYFEALILGTKPLQIKCGFIHPERQGVVAINQRGGGRNLAQTRLYAYPDIRTETLHLLTLGDKTTQKADIALSHQYAVGFRKAAEQAAENYEDPEEV